jgi:hypothetical protein
MVLGFCQSLSENRFCRSPVCDVTFDSRWPATRASVDPKFRTTLVNGTSTARTLESCPVYSPARETGQRSKDRRDS